MLARPERRDVAIACGLVLALTLPFAGKAFHVDDVYFIEVARNVLRDPLRPFSGAAGLEDVDLRVFDRLGTCPNTFDAMAHPPLVPYAIAAVTAAAGRLDEHSLHLAFLAFALVATAATWALARRFTARPLDATLLLVSSPIFLLSAESLMTDMPALAFSLGGLALFVHGVDASSRPRVVAGGLLLGLALVTRYSTLVMAPVFLAYAATRGRWRAALPALGAGGLVFALWAGQNLAVHGRLHVLAGTRHYGHFFGEQSFDLVGVARKALGDGAALGGTAFGAAFLLLLVRARGRFRTFGLGFAAALAVFVLWSGAVERLASYDALSIGAVCASFGAGALLLAEAFRAARHPAAPTAEASRRRRDAGFLGLWLGLTLLGAVLLLPFGAARYLLPALPPLVLLLVRRWQPPATGARAWRLAVAFVVLLGAALGTLLGLADAELAGRYRTLAAALRHDNPGRRLWFVGEWGFRHYMRAMGGLYLSSTSDSPGTSEFVVRPRNAGMHEMSPEVRRRAVLYQTIELQSRWPVRLMSFEARAGYYSHHWGFLPWSPSHVPLDTIEVFEVRAPARPAARDSCASS